MGSIKPKISTNPDDATFSYIKPEDKSLWGPFCSGCMNSWSGYFTNQIDIFLHLKCHSKLYKIENLRRENTIETPFKFRNLPEEVRKNPCYGDECPRMKALEAAREARRQVRASLAASDEERNRVERSPARAEERRTFVHPCQRKDSRERWEDRSDRGSDFSGDRNRYEDGGPLRTSDEIERRSGYRDDRGPLGRNEDPYEQRERDIRSRGEESYFNHRDSFEERRRPDSQQEHPTSIFSQESGRQFRSNSPQRRNLIHRDLPKNNPLYIEERRPVEFPLLHGTRYTYCKSIGKLPGVWDSRRASTMVIYSRIREKRAEVKEAFDSENWKTINCEVCEDVDPNEPYVEHVLSNDHYYNIKRLDRWVTVQHFDRLDFFLKTLEKNIKIGNAKDYQEWTTLQQIPLLAKWNCQNGSKMPQKEYNQKLDELEKLMKTVDKGQINAYQKRMAKDLCFWCSKELSTLYQAIDHLTSKEHREIAYSKSNVLANDIDEYIGMARKAQPALVPKKEDSPEFQKSPMKNDSSKSSFQASLVSSSSKKVNPTTSFPPPRTVDEGKMQLPFLLGYESPVQPLAEKECFAIGTCIKDIITRTPKFKSALCTKLNNRGVYELNCAPCKKILPNPSACLEHVMSSGHMRTLMDNNKRFSKVYDACVVISIILDTLEMEHDHITTQNVEKYFNILQDLASNLKEGIEQNKLGEKKQDISTKSVNDIEKKVEGIKIAPCTIAKLEDKSSTPKYPFLIPNEKPSDGLSLTQCLMLTKPLRKIICENEKSRMEILRITPFVSVVCYECQDRNRLQSFSSPYQIWEHIVSQKHIENVYKNNKQFSYTMNYFEALRFLSCSKIPVTVETAPKVFEQLWKDCSGSVPKNNPKSQKITPTVPKPGPVKSSSSRSIVMEVPSLDSSFVRRCNLLKEDKAKCVLFMNKTSNYGFTILTDGQLQSICEAVKREFGFTKKCFMSSYGKLAEIIPHSCPICQYRALCCCDYVIHIFGTTHFNLIIENKLQVTVLDVNFWLHQLVQLKMNSKSPEDAKIEDDIVTRCWQAINITPLPVEKALAIEHLKAVHFIGKDE